MFDCYLFQLTILHNVKYSAGTELSVKYDNCQHGMGRDWIQLINYVWGKKKLIKASEQHHNVEYCSITMCAIFNNKGFPICGSMEKNPLITNKPFTALSVNK